MIRVHIFYCSGIHIGKASVLSTYKLFIVYWLNRVMYRCQEKSSVFLLIYKDVEEGKKIDESIFWRVRVISLSFRNFPGSPVVKIAGSMGSIPGQGTKIPYAMPKTKQTNKKTEFQIAGLGFSPSLCLKVPEPQGLSTCYDRNDEWMNDFRGIEDNIHPSDVS